MPDALWAQSALANYRPRNELDPQMLDVTLEVNGQQHKLSLDSRTSLLDALRETSRSHRHQERLRPRAVRRVHRAAQWAARQFLPHPRGSCRRSSSNDDRRTSAGRRNRKPVTGAGRFRRARRISVRLLHAWPDLLRNGAAPRGEGRPAQHRELGVRREFIAATYGRGNTRAHEREHLPLRRLPQHRRGRTRRRSRSGGNA